MNVALHEIPVEERIRMVEDILDSIAAEKNFLALTPEQKTELDQRLDAYEIEGNSGRLASAVIADIRRKL
ncbi:MAG: addiction module protein [Sideroxydans sp.]|nr:addiction module protein [Sideroxydans sp.]